MRQPAPHAKYCLKLVALAGPLIFSFFLFLPASNGLSEGIVFLPCELNTVGDTEIVRPTKEQTALIFIFNNDFANIGKFKDIFSNSEVVNRGVAITLIQDERVISTTPIEFVFALSAKEDVISFAAVELVIAIAAVKLVVMVATTEVIVAIAAD